MRRRRNPQGNQVRRALPPLHDKEVELVSITKQNMLNNVWSVRLMVNGQPYQILKQKCRDELDVLVWLAKLRTKEQTNEHRRSSNAGRIEHLSLDRQ